MPSVLSDRCQVRPADQPMTAPVMAALADSQVINQTSSPPATGTTPNRKRALRHMPHANVPSRAARPHEWLRRRGTHSQLLGADSATVSMERARRRVPPAGEDRRTVISATPSRGETHGTRRPPGRSPPRRLAITAWLVLGLREASSFRPRAIGKADRSFSFPVGIVFELLMSPLSFQGSASERGVRDDRPADDRAGRYPGTVAVEASAVMKLPAMHAAHTGTRRSEDDDPRLHLVQGPAASPR